MSPFAFREPELGAPFEAAGVNVVDPWLAP